MKAILFSLLIFAAPLVPAQSLSVFNRSVQEIEMGTLNYLELRYAGETFTLVPPPNWRVETDSKAATVRFISLASNAAVELRFATNEARQVLASSDALLQQAAPFLSDVRVLEEFPTYSGSAAGKAVDLSFTLLRVSMRGRAVAVPFTGGCVTLVLTCSADDFKRQQSVLGALANTLQQKTVSRAGR